MPTATRLEIRPLRPEEHFTDHRECDWALWEYLRYVEDEDSESFRVHGAFLAGELQGAVIVCRLEQESFGMVEMLVVEEELAGPYFRARSQGEGVHGGDVLLLESLWCEPGAPVDVLLALIAVAGEQGLPVYASFAEQRLLRIFERRYPVAA